MFALRGRCAGAKVGAKVAGEGLWRGAFGRGAAPVCKKSILNPNRQPFRPLSAPIPSSTARILPTNSAKRRRNGKLHGP